MKYILFTLLAFAVIASAESFNIPVQHDIYTRTQSTTFSGARNATSTSPTGTTNTTADTLMSAVGYTASGTLYKVWRTRLLSDSINGLGGHSSYLDSMAVDSLHTARLDSIVLDLYAQNLVNLGACAMLYAYVFDTVHTSRNYDSSSFATVTLVNDVWTPDMTSFCTPFLFDSAEADTGHLQFTISNRTVLDEIQDLMEVSFTTGKAQGLRFDIVTCYDKDELDWGTADPYQFKVSFASITHATSSKRPTLTGYWTDVPPAVNNTLPWFQQNPFNQLPFGTKPFAQ